MSLLRSFRVPTPGVFSGPLFLDGRTDIAVAHSFQRLRSDYTGALVRIRRSSDNTEQDFGAGLPAVNWAEVLTFIGAGSGFAPKWYDQGGNGRDFVQATASQQPQMILAATGYPAALFDGVNDLLKTAAFTLNQPWSFNTIHRTVSAPATYQVFDGFTTDSGEVYGSLAPTTPTMYAGGNLPSNTTVMPVGTRGAMGGTFNGASSLFEINAATVSSFTGNPGAANPGGFSLGGTPLANFPWNGEMQAFIAYNTAHTSAQLKSDNAALRSAWGF